VSSDGDAGVIPAEVLLHESARFVGRSAVVIRVAQRGGGLKCLECGPAIAGFEQYFAELKMRAAMHPRPAIQRGSLSQIRLRLADPSKRRTRGATLVEPQRVLAKDPRAVVVGEFREAVGEKPFRVLGAACAQAGRAALYPQQAIAGKLLT